MTSIVITPFDREHAKDYKAYIEDAFEMDEETFAIDMPACVELLDVREIERQLAVCREALGSVIDALLDHPDAENACTKVHLALSKARGAYSV